MNTATHSPTTHTIGERVELGRYTVPDGQRALYGQRVDGVVRVTDHPAEAHGRCYLVERELEQDGHAALNALVADYLQQAEQLGRIPATGGMLKQTLEAER